MSTLTENVEKVKSAHAALSASIEAKGVSVPTGTKLTGMPALVDQIQSGGGFTEDTTTLSVAFGGVAKKITPKDVISFSSLTWQGTRHELGSKDYGVFDGNFQLDEAFWPAKPLPGYIYFRSQLLDNGYVILKDSNNNEIVKNVQTAVIKIPNDMFLLNGFAEQTNNVEFEITDSDSLGATVHEGGLQSTFDTNKYYFITAKTKLEPKQHYLLFNLGNQSTTFYIDNNEYFVTQTAVIPINNSFYANPGGYMARYKKFDDTLGEIRIYNGQTYFPSDFDNADFISITEN